MQADDTRLVGQAIRRIRKEKKISLQTLAARSGVATGMLSQIERDLGNPSLKTLARIRQALDVPLSALFEADDETAADAADAGDLAAHVRRDGTRRVMQFGTPLMTKEMLTPPAGQRLQFMVLNIQPGGTSGAPPLSYAAEKGGMVLQGAFELELDGRTLQLQRGDSFQFDGATPHVFRNPYDEPASILWIIAHEPAAQRHF
ncbi:helix-turn-helix domain-containing protein [Bordetella bronchiseptica]|uniref:helix-turn-helix domain-containing protein n=1 Tax=Bordetella bronchiseptica TaxID=518 RepID=UPI000461F64F|nr:cupin domain-containing protein [Bordetella bronchiseptica]AWP73609.1 transcriptional regulator [Bordetella bronchiseptica]KDB96534.1 cupin domain protein [Bordetella bronchiseptica E010]KDB97694.1 cupin domain protein [Bordetella bronchiseptica D993]KDD33706.1 cupin domain protein [Bordetella bronchiseptica MBORD839]KFJ55679.1 helix-turn-helix family protein [Bordetella bronchiseptica]